jgi:hypothetical protein
MYHYLVDIFGATRQKVSSIDVAYCKLIKLPGSHRGIKKIQIVPHDQLNVPSGRRKSALHRVVKVFAPRDKIYSYHKVYSYLACHLCVYRVCISMCMCPSDVRKRTKMNVML